MFFKFIDFSTTIDQSFDNRIEELRFDAVVAAKLNRGRKRDEPFRDGQKEEGTGTIGA